MLGQVVKSLETKIDETNQKMDRMIELMEALVDIQSEQGHGSANRIDEIAERVLGHGKD